MQTNGHKKRIAIKYGTVIRYTPDRKLLVVWDDDGTQIEEFAKILRFFSSPLTDTNNNFVPPYQHFLRLLLLRRLFIFRLLSYDILHP